MASDHLKPIHPHDKPLLRPLASLGKSTAGTGGFSFLRRTEYVASQGPMHFSSSTSKDLLRVRNDPKRKRKPNVDREDPVNIIRYIVKGFDVAYPKDAYRGEDSTQNIRGAEITDADTRAWTNPRHPTKDNVELLDSYPVLPDLEAMPTTGFYMVTKFITNPVAASDSYDERLDSAILKPISDPAVMARFNERRLLAEADPSLPGPIPEFDYDLYLPDNPSAARGMKRKLDVTDPENDDEDLYTDENDGKRTFKYARLRTYETYQQTGDPKDIYGDTVALALHDPETAVGAVPGTKERLTKGAYYYPVVQRSALRPKRNMGRTAMSQTQQETIDQLQVLIGDMNEEYLAEVAEQTTKLESGAGAQAIEV